MLCHVPSAATRVRTASRLQTACALLQRTCKRMDASLLNNIVVVVVSLSILVVITWATLFLLLPLLEKYNESLRTKRQSETTQRRGLTLQQASGLFDKETVVDREEKYVAIVQTDAYDGLSLDGPLVPLDCDKSVRVCLTDNDCSILCKRKNGVLIDVKCDPTDLVCRPSATTSGDDDHVLPPDQPEPNCKTDKGEYALLQGYNELGIAQWNCVQLYPGWMDYSKYCENGVINIDTRKRAPSYLDCTCPENTLRMVYSKSQLGQEVFGLPHCVDRSLKHLYEADYLFV